MDKQIIDINFFPLKNQNFNLTIYVQKSTSNDQRSDIYDFEVKRYNLQLDNDAEYKIYFVTLKKQDNFSEYTVSSNHNNKLTVWYIYNQLYNNAKIQNIEVICYKKYEIYIDIIGKKSQIGAEAISIIPKYIKGKFGFIINFHFRKDNNAPFNKEVQIASLSIDQSGKQNTNFYSDKYNKILSFFKSDKISVFYNLDINITNQDIGMLKIESDRLSIKRYVFGNGNSDVSQFKGVSNHGPFQLYAENPMLCFVYRANEKDYSHTLYYALNGKSYPTFSGMEKMFKFKMNKDSVIGIQVNDFSPSEISSLIDEIKNKSSNRPIIPIIIVPWVKETATDEQTKLYYLMKHHFIKERIVSQFVGIPRIKNYDNLKWSIASIGLQIFTKLGGSPWCMEIVKNKCLIIGIGQSHKKNSINKIEKYYSYSIMTDSSGIFNNIKILSSNTNKEEYLNGLVDNLKTLILNEVNNYDNIVIHTSFRLRDAEISKINDLIAILSEETKKNFMVIRFSDKHSYMGFNINANSKTPFESTIIQLTNNEYLLWFEGLSSTTHTVKTRISAPMHLTIDFPTPNNYNQTRDNLQDAINLSGANWRGFNAKTTPVSILYARLLSSFLAKFEEYNLEEINIEKLTPWFI